ncbi:MULTISPECIES: membrane protein insertase YidC [Campylobacter]|uniref:membrane protein insertase YidC n=1 Tax=Campylobacter TaxID=194 RepID=UPI000A32F7D9|nr:membrane protein insertase YidC [Campylobacter sp. P0024]MCR8679205.1 membrane protein insertase YidC [Campylobacter sp. RM19072]
MLDKLSTQQRLIIATVISVLFFIAYDALFAPKQPLDINKTLEQNQSAPTTTTTNSTTQAPKQTSKNIATIEGINYTATIDELGRISSFTLKDSKFKNENGEQISLLKPTSPLPLEIRFSDRAINEEAFKVAYKASSDKIDVGTTPATLSLTQDLSSVSVVKNITFYADGSYDIDVKVSSNYEYFITAGFRPVVAVDGYTVHGVLLRKEDDSLEIIEDGDAKGNEVFRSVDLLANSDRYYTTLFYDSKKSMEVFIQKDTDENTLSFVRNIGNFSAKGYIGPKDYKILKSINPSLVDTIEYGWFTFIAKPAFLLLDWLYSFIGNWGFAIVALTIIIRIVLFPLTYKGMVSMNKLKDLAPKMKEIQAKYKGDPQKINAHVMELYKKHGANPMGGCLPILIQIPIFFAIYRVLLNAIELKGAEWILWINDLAELDPYFILPILMGITMYIQQHITPTNFTDPMQAKIMKFLPLIFTFFFITFPAGLTLYWFINNLCSIAQQMVVNKIFERHKSQEIAEKHHGN